MSRVTLEPATTADDAGLRRLMTESPMGGRIQIAFEREPSYFHATEVQGRIRQVYLGRDSRDASIVGVGARSIKPVFVNGEPENVGYLSDLRLRPAYRGGTLLARGYRLLRELHKDRRVRLYYTVIGAENRQALATIASGRAGLPAYRDMGSFHCAAVNVTRRRPELPGTVEIVRGRREWVREIVACLNDFGRAKQFAPVYAVEDFEPGGWLRDFKVEDFYLAVRGSHLVGALARWDQTRFKQTRVVGYAGSVRLLRPLINLGTRVVGGPRLPRPGERLDACYVAGLAIADSDVSIFRVLLRQLYNDAVNGPHTFFLLGLHERDPLASVLHDYRCSPYQGRLFCVHFEDGEGAWRALDGRVPHVELATL